MNLKQIKNDYLNNQLTIQQIADKYNQPPSTIYAFMVKNDISRRKQGNTPRDDKLSQVKTMLDQNKSIDEIRVFLGYKQNYSVYRYLYKHNIYLRQKNK